MRAIYIIQDRTEGEKAYHEAKVIASSPEIAISKAKVLLGTDNDLFIIHAIEWEASIQRSAVDADMNLDEGDYK